MRIAICHQSVFGRDAIGHDILGIYHVLERMGLQPLVVCQHTDLDPQQYRVVRTPARGLDAKVDAYLYHHSNFWEDGGAMVAKTRKPVFFRYHNITPAEHFVRYNPQTAANCDRGREQTRAFARLNGHNHWWIADSEYNASEVLAEGVPPERVRVVAPLSEADKRCRPPAEGARPERIRMVSVGRLVPNKGHAHAVKIARRLHDISPVPVELIFAGKIIDGFERYYEELAELIRAEGAKELVRFVIDSATPELMQLIESADLYLCPSLHEGFCVPVIEAQALGVPVLGFEGGAVKGTAGPDQLVGPTPESEDEYLLYARLALELWSNRRLRRRVVERGLRNVVARFEHDRLENQILDVLWEGCEAA